SIMHETPNRFGKEYSGAVTGLQMAAAYTGSTLMTVIFRWIGHFNLNLYSYVIFVFLLGIIFSFYYVQKHIN
ncbi:MAG: MFS transporter, partial [Armatimonadetes bacterium]|nr:MFS transporter [Candidatus Hippobium faecium]